MRRSNRFRTRPSVIDQLLLAGSVATIAMILLMR
jgi:hypothetical protein